MASSLAAAAGGAPVTAWSIRRVQRDAILRILNFNRVDEDAKAEDSGVMGWSDEWKVLIFDEFCRDVIAPLLSVNDLRKRGVTLHLELSKERERIADVPAVYLVTPSRTSLEAIIKDCSNELYDKCYLNFTYPLDRPALEDLARRAVDAECVRMIQQVHEQHVRFISVEHDLFTLAAHGSFKALNSKHMSDTQVEDMLSTFAHALLSVCICLDCVPVIKCQTGTVGELVARKLDACLRAELSNRSHSMLFGEGFRAGGFQRPVLFIQDRSLDLATALGHPSNYQSLLGDVYDIRLNAVSVPTDAGNKTYNLDSDADAFWAAHRGKPFPEAISANAADLEEIKTREAAIRRTTDVQEQEEAAAVSALGTEGLADAVDSLPALLRRRTQLEMHTNVLKAVMNQVAARHIPVFYELEQKSAPDKEGVLGMLGGDKGSRMDKLRLAAVYLVQCSARNAPVDVEELLAAIEGASAPASGASDSKASDAADVPVATVRAVIKYLEKLLRQQRAVAVVSGGGGAAAGAGDKWSSMLGSAAASWVTAAASGALSGIKSLVGSDTRLPITQRLATVMEGTAADADSYITLDPKLPPNSAAGSGVSTFSRAIVFMVGGGSYTEYQNVQEYANAASKQVIYGTTEMLSARAFVQQLVDLASESA